MCTRACESTCERVLLRESQGYPQLLIRVPTPPTRACLCDVVETPVSISHARTSRLHHQAPCGGTACRGTLLPRELALSGLRSTRGLEGGPCPPVLPLDNNLLSDWELSCLAFEVSAGSLGIEPEREYP